MSPLEMATRDGTLSAGTAIPIASGLLMTCTLTFLPRKADFTKRSICASGSCFSGAEYRWWHLFHWHPRY